ncbi:hypothetical protein AB0H88_44080 [Nonomuraea sp. NPDC050680]|uniref:hypothetical protein n=1 Tax=Nonomuraea sp. NPDC050680 TaxID=3154630 RepID=UPI0033F71D99
MRHAGPTLTAVLLLVVSTACSSAPPASPRDTRSLGDMTAEPLACDGLISARALRIVVGALPILTTTTGLPDKRLTKGRRYTSCAVKVADAREWALDVSLDDPFRGTPRELADTMAFDKGRPLRKELGPGYSATVPEGKEPAFAYVYGWTPGHERLLSIRIVLGAARDSEADAVELFRYLKPIMLTPRKSR